MSLSRVKDYVHSWRHAGDLGILLEHITFGFLTMNPWYNSVRDLVNIGAQQKDMVRSLKAVIVYLNREIVFLTWMMSQ